MWNRLYLLIVVSLDSASRLNKDLKLLGKGSLAASQLTDEVDDHLFNLGQRVGTVAIP